MVEQAADMDAVRLAHGLEVHITLHRMRELRIRIWIAAQLITLAARIANLQIVFEPSNEALEEFETREIGH